MNGITELHFNLMQRKLTVTRATLGKSDAIKQALITIDMHAVPLVATAVQAQSDKRASSKFSEKMVVLRLWWRRLHFSRSDCMDRWYR